MNVIKVTNKDKQAILEFCKNTFSWGDYIKEAWDSWLKEGVFLKIHDCDQPVAICHASINKKGKQVWIEGIRVNEKFRRKGYASKLIIEAEKIGKNNDCNIAHMIIASTNHKSLELARKLGYTNFERWNFYSLKLKQINSTPKIRFANFDNKSPSLIFSSNFFYVKSWRWLPLDDSAKKSLIKSNQIIYSEKNNLVDTIAIFSESEHFESTLLVTIISESNNTSKEIFEYIQFIANKNNYERIQILTKQKLNTICDDLENKFTFILMKKIIQ